MDDQHAAGAGVPTLGRHAVLTPGPTLADASPPVRRVRRRVLARRRLARRRTGGPRGADRCARGVPAAGRDHRRSLVAADDLPGGTPLDPGRPHRGRPARRCRARGRAPGHRPRRRVGPRPHPGRTAPRGRARDRRPAAWPPASWPATPASSRPRCGSPIPRPCACSRSATTWTWSRSPPTAGRPRSWRATRPRSWRCRGAEGPTTASSAGAALVVCGAASQRPWPWRKPPSGRLCPWCSRH